MKILVIVITKDYVRPDCWDSILSQDYPDFSMMVHVEKPVVQDVPIENRDIKQMYLTYINCSHNRESARKIALASDAEKFFFVDSDIILPKNAMSELAKQPFDVIGGYYKIRNDNRYASGRWVDNNVFINLFSVEPSITKVDSIGMGCAMFSRKALSDIYFRHGTDVLCKGFVKGNFVDMIIGECGSIGNMLAEKGYQPYMNGSVVCGHLQREGDHQHQPTREDLKIKVEAV